MIHKIEPLPNWAFLTSKYAFEDTESNTAIEQTARLYRKVQELIEEYNSFSRFEDAKIREAIQYMKDNLQDSVNNLIKEGKITVGLTYDVNTEHLDLIIMEEGEE